MPSAVTPSRTVNGALVARLENGDQVAETRYGPGPARRTSSVAVLGPGARGGVVDVGAEALAGEGGPGPGGGEAGVAVVDDPDRRRRRGGGRDGEVERALVGVVGGEAHRPAGTVPAAAASNRTAKVVEPPGASVVAPNPAAS